MYRVYGRIFSITDLLNRRAASGMVYYVRPWRRSFGFGAMKQKVFRKVEKRGIRDIYIYIR